MLVPGVNLRYRPTIFIMMEKTITYQNTSVAYSITGQGKTIVLLHGFGEDGTVWQKQVAFLKDNYRVLIPDIPGSGRSPFIANATIETYAAILKQILDEEINVASAEKITLIGHSMGGYITLAFAEKYPEYLEAFCLFHSSAFADDDAKKQTRQKAIEFIKEKGSAAFLKTSTPGLFTKEFAAAHAGQIDTLVEKGKNFSPEALVQYYQAMIARPDRTTVLKTFPHPVLFIIGEFDTAIPLQSSLQQCYLPEQAHVHLLSQSAHMGMWEETDKANQILLKFLQEV